MKDFVKFIEGNRGKRGGLMVSELYGASTPDRAVWVRALAGDIVFLGKTLFSRSASLHPGV